MDYGYIGRDDASPAPLHCCKCAGCLGNYACTAVPRAGVDKYTVSYLVGWIKSPGFKWVVVRSDNERALLKLIDVTSSNLPSAERVP